MNTPVRALEEPLATVVQIAPLLSVVVAVVAVLVAFGSRRTAKKSYELAKHVQENTNPNLSIHLVKARRIPLEVSGVSVGYTLRVQVQVTNLSTASIWLRRAALWIDYPLADGPGRSEVSMRIVPEEADTLAFPVELKGHQVLDGWLAFDITKTRTNGAAVDRHTLSLIDTHNTQWQYDDIRAGAA